MAAASIKLLGASFSKQQFVEELTKLLTDAFQHGVVPNEFSPTEWKKAVEEFQSSSIGDALTSLREVPAQFVESSAGDLLKKLGRVNVVTLLRASAFLDKVGTLVTEIGRLVAARESTQGGNALSDPRRELQVELDRAKVLMTGSVL